MPLSWGASPPNDIPVRSRVPHLPPFHQPSIHKPILKAENITFLKLNMTLRLTIHSAFTPPPPPFYRNGAKDIKTRLEVQW